MDLWTKSLSESVNGTNARRKSLPEDKGPDVPADASSSKVVQVDDVRESRPR
ncbi:hypothetical protein YC2023_114500 [Brassica napus]